MHLSVMFLSRDSAATMTVELRWELLCSACAALYSQLHLRVLLSGVRSAPELLIRVGFESDELDALSVDFF
ncbi:hypothetical protein MPTK1_6g11130 [Marchantia polymorpha subsp. ruderalis]|uniref:Uncharacterized protein n=2 Tax=Marchantia polymorpha TaxID=3197 RepID=A0AAF6BQU0_MARPO|nr:hypothetical protein MARPO_0016s0153 [Marchantia polymorpha]BBN14374.1 hypothetical protein Mp_6g11130 [Marchantia polymorpha subsp. ruderalis]|eukprot:PTQ45108.1 hypothetical protein MARPO_0016s0153 [Marchantia polymorpha]